MCSSVAHEVYVAPDRNGPSLAPPTPALNLQGINRQIDPCCVSSKMQGSIRQFLGGRHLYRHDRQTPGGILGKEEPHCVTGKLQAGGN
jgi:hypothetical protein